MRTKSNNTLIIRLVPLIVICLTIANISQAQLWQRHRTEIYIGGGASQMLGDLGGGDGPGKNDFRDLNLETTTYTGTAGIKYKLNELFTVRGGLAYARVAGDDALSEDNQGRRNRNLSVQTDIVEVSPMLEFYIFKDKLPMNRSLSRRYRKYGQGPNFAMYLATGFTMFYYRPTAQLNGTQHSLRPLSTEGQGIKPGTGLYSEFSFALPFSLGFKFNLTREWSIGLEAQARFTGTDYLDDVSSEYYDNDAIRNARGGVAAELADRRIEGSGGNGGIRGNPDNNDTYYMVHFTLNKRFEIKNRRRPVRRRF